MEFPATPHSLYYRSHQEEDICRKTKDPAHATKAADRKQTKELECFPVRALSRTPLITVDCINFWRLLLQNIVSHRKPRLIYCICIVKWMKRKKKSSNIYRCARKSSKGSLNIACLSNGRYNAYLTCLFYEAFLTNLERPVQNRK